MKDFIYGIHPVLELIESGREPESVLIQRGLANPAISGLKAALKERGLVYKTAPVEKLNRVTRKNHQGVVCFVAQVDYYSTAGVVQEAFEAGRTPLVLVLDRITDVRNFGSVCRSAAGAGADLVVIPLQGAARINADAVKASSGAIARVRIAREQDLKQCVRYLRDSGLRVLACSEKGKTPLPDCDLTGPVVILMGSEDAGIDPSLAALADDSVRIPMSASVASLNVAVAAGIILYETGRQRAG